MGLIGRRRQREPSRKKRNQCRVGSGERLWLWLSMLRIGELARQTGFTPKTLRYYEEAGLLHPDRRSESGYRLYGDAVIDRLSFVRSARGLGLHVNCISWMLAGSSTGSLS